MLVVHTTFSTVLHQHLASLDTSSAWPGKSNGDNKDIKYKKYPLSYTSWYLLVAVVIIYYVIVYPYLLSFGSFNNIIFRIFNYFICFFR